MNDVLNIEEGFLVDPNEVSIAKGGQEISMDWHIIVPVYNESRDLDGILRTLVESGYSSRITFVDDASTDSSADILKNWQHTLQCNVVTLSVNHNKEGAIRAVMEEMNRQGVLPRYTILLDADSFIQKPESGESVDASVQQAIRHMDVEDITAMAFRIEAIIEEDNAFLSKCVFYDYSAVQVDNWIASRFSVLWVINGPGGIFDSGCLLTALRNMTPDFETGDLMITVNLMKEGEKIGFWPKITVKTAVPGSLSEYFNQRRRWERGTLKVFWKEKKFYFHCLFRAPILIFYLFLWLLFPVGVIVTSAGLLAGSIELQDLWFIIAVNYVFWVLIGVLKCFFNRWNPPAYRRAGKIIYWSFMNGLLFILVTGPSRLLGFFEAVSTLASSRK